MTHAVTLGLLLVFVLASAIVEARPQTLHRDSIPDQYKWDFSHIYPDWDAWKQDMARLEAMMDEYAAMQGTLSQGPDQLLKAFQLSDELGKILYKVYRYPQLQRDVNTRNQEVSAR